jgi:hypothetical protein
VSEREGKYIVVQQIGRIRVFLSALYSEDGIGHFVPDVKQAILVTVHTGVIQSQYMDRHCPGVATLLDPESGVEFEL